MRTGRTARSIGHFGAAGERHQGLSVAHVAGGPPGVLEPAPHRQHQLGTPDQATNIAGRR